MTKQDSLKTTCSLSICMPTYNFAAYIGETLDNIIPQMEPGMEIIIVDGASKDNTEEVVREYQKKHPFIKYHRCKERGGIDKDMAISVSLAKGDYCWLFSSDDIMYPGAIARLRKELKSGSDVYLCGFDLCSLDLKQVLGKYRFFKNDKDSAWDFEKQEDRKAFFQNAQSTVELMGYMSSIVFKRVYWESAKCDDVFYGCCFAHAARLFSLFPKLKLQYLTGPYLINRRGNDSFMDKGFLHRIGITIHGYCLIADILFGHNSFEAVQIRRIIIKENRYNLLRAKEYGLSNKDRIEFKAMYRKLFVDYSLSNLVHKNFWQHTPFWVDSCFRFGLRSLRNGSRFIRSMYKR